jgi:hypothetical protein
MAANPVAVGVDGSPQSLLAAEWAAMEAVRRGLGLRIESAPGIVPPMHSCQGSPETAADVLRDVSAQALGSRPRGPGKWPRTWKSPSTCLRCPKA